MVLAGSVRRCIKYIYPRQSRYTIGLLLFTANLIFYLHNFFYASPEIPECPLIPFNLSSLRHRVSVNQTKANFYEIERYLAYKGIELVFGGKSRPKTCSARHKV